MERQRSDGPRRGRRPVLRWRHRGRPRRHAGAVEAPRAGTLTDTRSAEGWFATLTRDRDALFARVARAAPSERLDVTIEHFMFGPLNWRETLLFMRLHDLDHAGQLDKIATALGATPPT